MDESHPPVETHKRKQPKSQKSTASLRGPNPTPPSSSAADTIASQPSMAPPFAAQVPQSLDESSQSVEKPHGSPDSTKTHSNMSLTRSDKAANTKPSKAPVYSESAKMFHFWCGHVGYPMICAPEQIANSSLHSSTTSRDKTSTTSAVRAVCGCSNTPTHPTTSA